MTKVLDCFGSLEREPVSESPMAQMRLERSDRDRVDEATQRVRLTQSLRLAKHSPKDFLSQVLGFRARAEGAFRRREHHRRETVPGFGDGPCLPGAEALGELGIARVA